MFLIIEMIDAASPSPRVMSSVLPEVLPNQLKQLSVLLADCCCG